MNRQINLLNTHKQFMLPYDVKYRTIETARLALNLYIMNESYENIE
jgi:hypothetical protein